jgi:hypothetical protein
MVVSITDLTEATAIAIELSAAVGQPTVVVGALAMAAELGR